MLSQVFLVKDSEVVGASGCRVFGGTDGFSDQVRDERQEVWVKFVTLAEGAHYAVGLRFTFVRGDAGELLGETFGYGSLFCAGFRGALGGSEGD